MTELSWRQIAIILQLGTVLVALALAWGTLRSDATAMNQRIADHESRIRMIENRVLEGLSRIDQRLMALERDQTRARGQTHD